MTRKPHPMPTATSLAIEKGVPIPSRTGAEYLSVVKNMDVGDSIFFPDKRGAQLTYHMDTWRRATGFRFSSRTNPEGVRVWRTA